MFQRQSWNVDSLQLLVREAFASIRSGMLREILLSSVDYTYTCLENVDGVIEYLLQIVLIIYL